MNRGIVIFILKWKGWLSSQGVRRCRWRKIIGKSFIDSGESKKYENGADQFCRTWDDLESEGLI